MKRMLAALCACVLLPVRPGFPAAGAESGNGTYVVLEPDAVPQAVLDAFTCIGDPEDFVSRRFFRGALVFARRCPGNNQNDVQSLVRAENEDGRNAAVLSFPPPTGQGSASTEISNPRLFPDTGTIGEIAVEMEHAEGEACRFERLWRFETWTPELVFERRSEVCEPDAGGSWEISIDRRTKDERREDW